jgi:ABC-type transport system involved in multi-copper enzyme maturation permease subunit
VETNQTAQSQSIVPDDFPDALGAMLVKELRQGIRSNRFAVPFLGVHAIMLLAFAFDVRFLRENGVSNDSIRDGFGSQLAFWWAAVGLLVVIMPITALDSLTAEQENRSGELLCLAGLTRWRVILGKWTTHCVLAGLTAVTMLPYLLVRYFLGGMDLLLTSAICVSVLALNGAANALAIGISGYVNAGMRWMVGCTLTASFAISLLMVSISSAMFVNFLAPGPRVELLTRYGVMLGICASCVLFTTIGWQLGRLHIRPYSLPDVENPTENATTGGVIALALLTPFILGAGLILTMGLGGILSALLFAWVMLLIDRQRSRTSP